MNLATIEQIVPELREALCGRRFGRVFQLSKFDLAIDFRLSESRYLFISVSPSDPRIYLIRRRLRDVERSSTGPFVFTNSLKKQLSNAWVVTVDQVAKERIIELNLEGEDEFGEHFKRSLVVQLTGRSANLFVTNDSGVILDRLRETQGDGQEIGTKFNPPARPATPAGVTTRRPGTLDGSLSEHLDRLDLE
ncbi:MAG TPA: NFACT family protein, partial [Pyrinomonadaceae bacterium]|nr:NFACT family protein [Pyrinomonadaceae bacterium]